MPQKLESSFGWCEILRPPLYYGLFLMLVEKKEKLDSGPCGLVFDGAVQENWTQCSHRQLFHIIESSQKTFAEQHYDARDHESTST